MEHVDNAKQAKTQMLTGFKALQSDVYNTGHQSGQLQGLFLVPINLLIIQTMKPLIV